MNSEEYERKKSTTALRCMPRTTDKICAKCRGVWKNTKASPRTSEKQKKKKEEKRNKEINGFNEFIMYRN